MKYTHFHPHHFIHKGSFRLTYCVFTYLQCILVIKYKNINHLTVPKVSKLPFYNPLNIFNIFIYFVIFESFLLLLYCSCSNPPPFALPCPAHSLLPQSFPYYYSWIQSNNFFFFILLCFIMFCYVLLPSYFSPSFLSWSHFIIGKGHCLWGIFKNQITDLWLAKIIES